MSVVDREFVAVVLPSLHAWFALLAVIKDVERVFFGQSPRFGFLLKVVREIDALRLWSAAGKLL